MKIIETLFNVINEFSVTALCFNLFLLASLFIFVYEVIKYETKNKTLEKLNTNIKSNFKEKELSLLKEFDETLNQEGNFTDKNKTRKLLKLLNDSGLRIHFPELSVGMFITLIISLCLLSGIIGFMLSKSFTVGIICVAAAVFIIFVLLETSKNRNNKTIEKELLKFVDILANVSRSEGNLAEMFGKTAPYLNEPLKSLVVQCYYEMKSSGNTTLALQHFSERANHKKLREIIGYLKICSQRNESYEEVIHETKESIRSYIAYRNERTEIKKIGLVDLLIMGVGGSIIVFALSTMITNINIYLLHNIIGQILLSVALMILLYAFWIVIKAESD